MTNKKLKIAVTLVLLGAAVAAHAQIRPAYHYPGGTAPSAAGAASMQVGDSPVFFSPYIGVAAGHDDNLFLSNANRRSSTLYVTSPGFKLDARSPSSVLQFNYQGQIGRYAQSEDDNYVDHTARAQADMAFGGRTFLRLGYDYIHSHDPRGSTDRAISTRPDKYWLYAPSATFAFGAPGAQGRAEVYYVDSHKMYLNNRATTAASDRDTTEYGTAFYWRVMPKTYVLAEVRQTDISYELSNPFSGYERRYYGGVSWEATAATTGTLKVGQLRRNFDSGLPSASATSWEGLVTWAPRTYSTFDFYTSRQTSESTGLGSFILTEVSGVTWNHAWSSVLNSAVILRYQRDEYQGFDRTDDTKTLGFKVGYRFRRWLTLGAEYNRIQRNSNQNIFEYDKNLYMLTGTASM
jgi:hypothetical protein